MLEARIPPQNIEAEKAVLGACLIQVEAYTLASEILTPGMFYTETHQKVFQAMTDLSATSTPIDIITVTDKSGLRAYDVSVLTNTVVSSAHLPIHAKKVAECFMKREQIRIAGELYNAGFNEIDPIEAIETAEKELSALTSNGTKQAAKIDSICVEVVQDLERDRHRTESLTGISTGSPTLDSITSGLQSTDLIILAARPSVGKTAFVLSLAKHSPVMFFSLEMGAKQLVKRLLASEADMYLSSIINARLDDYQMQHLFEKGIRNVVGMPFFIDDSASITVGQIKAKLRRMVKKEGIKLCVIDYLQLIRSSLGKNANRHNQIGDISRELKIAAKEVGVPIIALSQLSRDIERRSNPIPQLSDLKESGDIEQDADIVMFLYGNPVDEGQIFLKIAKHRNGRLGTIRYEFDKPKQKFKDQGEGELTLSLRESKDNPF